ALVGLVQLEAPLLEQVVGPQNIGPGRAAAQRDDAWVLEQEQRVGDLALRARRRQLRLHPQAVFVLDQAQLADQERPAHLTAPRWPWCPAAARAAPPTARRAARAGTTAWSSRRRRRGPRAGGRASSRPRRW